MNSAMPSSQSVPSRIYQLHHEPSLSEFEKLCSRKTNLKDCPSAATIQHNVPIYDLMSLSNGTLTVDRTSSLLDEWHYVLLSGPGVLVFKSMFEPSLTEEVNKVFRDIIASEKSKTKGDHFAASGKNDRIWNSFGKHGLRDPSSFFSYYSNMWLSLISEAWLGPGYRITAQVNIVKPGGQAQTSHRDYHLGFQTRAACSRFPRSMQVASQLLTLQGGIAHTNMPLESGPTRFLPFSQRFEEGYMAYHLPKFKEYFQNNYVSIPLQQGDAVFFNPALFHAAGENKTDNFERSANLVQISSAFGKPMEMIDTLPLILQTWDRLLSMYKEQGYSPQVQSLVSAVAEGYPFPTNLDNRPPAPGGMAPESEQQLLLQGLKEAWTLERIKSSLTKMREDSRM